MAYYDSILCVSDLQAPFQHKDALRFLEAVKKKYWVNGKKSLVVNQGDEIDAHALGKWPKDPDGFSAGIEHHKACEFLIDYFDLFGPHPFCISNHTMRPWLRMQEAGIPKAFQRTIAEALCAPKGTEWRQHWIFNDVCFEHGEGVSGPTAALSAALANLMSTSIGHQHSGGGVQYYQARSKRIFGLNTGCLIDTKAYAFRYGEKMRKKATLGMGVVLGEEAIFVPMLMTENGGWTGKLP